MSLIQGIVPGLLKDSGVSPIYKNNDKNKCENYRPISLLSNLNHTRLYEFIENSGQFYEKQFGFRKKYSTNHALLNIVEGIREKLDNKTFVCGVFIDLEQAFDTVNHQILLTNLNTMELEELQINGLHRIFNLEDKKLDLMISIQSLKMSVVGFPKALFLDHFFS